MGPCRRPPSMQLRHQCTTKLPTIVSPLLQNPLQQMHSAASLKTAKTHPPQGIVTSVFSQRVSHKRLTTKFWSPIDCYCVNCTKFAQSILRKIIQIVATILRLKCTKLDFGWGSVPDPAEGGAHTLPQTSWLNLQGPTSKERGREENRKRSETPPQ